MEADGRQQAEEQMVFSPLCHWVETHDGAEILGRPHRRPLWEGIKLAFFQMCSTLLSTLQAQGEMGPLIIKLEM